ncbi:hypothetical protein BCR44DRAFT_1441690, partial [Catenaria anguillulae PL171]
MRATSLGVPSRIGMCSVGASGWMLRETWMGLYMCIQSRTYLCSIPTITNPRKNGDVLIDGIDL